MSAKRTGKTSVPTDNEDHTRRKAVDRSGYPLQVALEHQMPQVQNHGGHAWRVLATEVPWRSPSSDTEYVDAVLQRVPSDRAVVECKRVLRDGGKHPEEWLFMGDKLLDSRTGVMRGLSVHLDESQNQVYQWVDVQFSPKTPTAMFAMPREKSGASLRVDQIARNLVAATEAIARAEPKRAGFQERTYIPMIVTTAQLYVCSADAGAVNVERGTLPDNHAIRRVDAIRYTKAMQSGIGFRFHRTIQNLSELVLSQQRSVLIVTASKLQGFLAEMTDVSVLVHTD